MKRIFVFIFLSCILALDSCSQETSRTSVQDDSLSTKSSKAIAFNNKASDLQMSILGMQLSKDSSIVVERLLKEAIHLDPNYRIAYVNLWEHYKMNKQFGKAIQISSDWLLIKPKDVDFRLKRAVINDFMNNTEVSRNDYHFVAAYFSANPLPSITPNMTELDKSAVLSRIFTRFLITGSKDSSIIIFEKLLKEFPQDEQIVSAYKKFDIIDREGYIRELLGIH